MPRHTRRTFISRLLAVGTGAAFTIAGTKASGRVLGAPTTRFASAWPASTAGAARTSTSSAGMKDVAGHLPDRSRHAAVRESRRASEDPRRAASEPQVRAGHPQGAGRQEPRRRLHRHAQPLALADDHLGLPGRQGRVRREAAAATTSSKAASASRRRASTSRIVQHGTQQRSSAAAGRARSPPCRRASTASCWCRKGYCCKPRWSIGTSDRRSRRAGLGLRPLARPGARAAVSRQPGPLQLALVLGHRQRRHRQPGRARDGRRPLGASRARRCPRASGSLGGRFGYEDQGQTPNTQMAVFDYGDAQLVFEVRGLHDRRTSTARRSATSSTARKASVVVTATSPQGGVRPETDRPGAARLGAGGTTSATSSPPCAAASEDDSTPTSSKATTQPPCATWPTSPTAWASTCPSIPRRKAFGDNKEAYETLARMEQHLPTATA